MMDQYEKHVIRSVLKKHNYNITKAACELGLHRQGLQYRIKKHNLTELIEWEKSMHDETNH